MKANRRNLFMMLMVLSVGTSAVQAARNSVEPIVVEDTNASFVREMNDIERCISDVRHDARDTYEDDSVAQLDELSSRVQMLEDFTTSKNVRRHDHRIHKLQDDIESARQYVHEHGRRSSRYNRSYVDMSSSYSRSYVGMPSRHFLDNTHDIHYDINSVRRDARNISVDRSMAKLSDIELRIDSLEDHVNNSDNSEMRRHHVRSLRKQLDHARNYVQDHGRVYSSFAHKMHNIQADIRATQEYAADYSVESSMDELANAELRINMLERNFDNSQMHRNDILSLREELDGARDYVVKYGQKSVDSMNNAESMNKAESMKNQAAKNSSESMNSSVVKTSSTKTTTEESSTTAPAPVVIQKNADKKA